MNTHYVVHCYDNCYENEQQNELSLFLLTRKRRKSCFVGSNLTFLEVDLSQNSVTKRKWIENSYSESNELFNILSLNVQCTKSPETALVIVHNF